MNPKGDIMKYRTRSTDRETDKSTVDYGDDGKLEFSVMPLLPPNSDGTAYEPDDDKPCVLCSWWFGLVVVIGVVLWAVLLGWWLLS